ncbi:MAG: hypothetical protein LBP87_03255 [Planctomycetaceae bacterium]|jgi:hypothetical protein|nr:hypothetical protein [Planctomycetaceae bacterium]
MSSVTIPQTELEQYLAIKDMMASNLCAKGVFTLPNESLAKMASKILNIDGGIPYRFTTGGTVISKPASNTTYYPATITLAPPSEASYNWGALLGTRVAKPTDYRLISATIRASWYSGTNYNNYNSIHFVQLNGTPQPNDSVGSDWKSATWNYFTVHRPYYSSYPDTSFNTTGSFSSSENGNLNIPLYPYSNSSSYAYFNPNYLNIFNAVWIVKRPFN